MIKGVPKVLIESRKLSIVNLMIEHFMAPISTQFRVSYKIVDGRVPLNKITIRKIQKADSNDNILIFNYKCQAKASDANSRVENTITIDKHDVLNALKRTSFKCTYCGSGLSPSKWQLDHVVPLSKGGENSSINITPSCKECNQMKGAMGIEKFLHQCRLIINNYK